MLKERQKTRTFIPSLTGRIVPFCISVAAMFAAYLIFKEPPTGGFALAWPIIAAVLAIFIFGYGYEASNNAALLSVSESGIKLNWFDEEILWGQILSITPVAQQGFQFGGPYIQLHFSEPISSPFPDILTYGGLPIHSDRDHRSFEDWWEAKQKQTPIWNLVTNNLMTINLGRLNGSAVEIETLLKRCLEQSRIESNASEEKSP